MTQLGQKSTSELNNLEKWIEQKRAEIANEKAKKETENKENEPIKNQAAKKPPISGEPLIFKLGDDYQIRKTRIDEQLKTEYKNTQIENEAFQRALNRQSVEKKPAPYFEVIRQDLFHNRPSTAQVRAAKRIAYKRELDEQLKQKDLEERSKRKMSVNAPPPEVIIQSDAQVVQKAANINEDYQIPVQNIPIRPPTPNKDPFNQLASTYRPPAPSYAYQPQLQNPPRNNYELSSALDRATMEMNINQVRLDTAAPTSYPIQNEMYYPPPRSRNISQANPTIERNVQINNTKVIPHQRAYDRDILSWTGVDIQRKPEIDSRKEQYARQLYDQIQSKERQKQIEKDKQNQYDRRVEQEMMTYDPFGKGGGGAPVKDSHGRVVADLRKMKNSNDAIENDGEARISTPRPLTQNVPTVHNETLSQRITDYNNPKRKVDYSYGEYLLQEAARKRKQKVDALAKEREEDARAEEKFLKEQEKLRLEAEQDKKKKVEEDMEKGKETEIQHRQIEPPRAPSIKENHEVYTKRKNIIEIDDWAEQNRQLEQKLKGTRQNGKISRNEIPRTPTSGKQAPLSTRSSAPQTTNSVAMSRKPTLRQSNNTNSYSHLRTSHGSKRQNSSLSEISWDNRSLAPQPSYNYGPPRHPPSKTHHRPHPSSVRVISQLDQLKKQIKDEYLRVQYNLNQQRINEPPRVSSARRHPVHALPEPTRPRSKARTIPDEHDILKTRDLYMNDPKLDRELTGEELLMLPNEEPGVRNTVRLDDETEFVSAADEPNDLRRTATVKLHEPSLNTESELDIETLNKKNTERLNELLAMEADSPDRPRI